VGGCPWFLKLVEGSVEVAYSGPSVEQMGAVAREVPEKLFRLTISDRLRSNRRCPEAKVTSTGLLGLALGNDETSIEVAKGSMELVVKFLVNSTFACLIV